MATWMARAVCVRAGVAPQQPATALAASQTAERRRSHALSSTTTLPSTPPQLQWTWRGRAHHVGIASATSRSRCSLVKSASSHLRGTLAGVCVSSAKADQCDAAVAAVEQQLGHALSTAPCAPPTTPGVFILSGASGVGKDSVLRRVQELRPDVHFVVTATTRAMRRGEEEGVDYLFIGTEEFEKMIADDELLEYAVVYGQYKGIPKTHIRAALARGTDVVLRVDVQGAATLKRLLPQAVSIFIVAESEKALVTRLAGRGTEHPTELLMRVQTAKDELARAAEFDFVLENTSGKMETTAALIASIVDAEKHRTSKTRVEI